MIYIVKFRRIYNESYHFNFVRWSEVMKYTDVDIPAISKDQVLIRVVATSVNFADIKSRYGKKEINHYLLFQG